jgi:hypothetical protein
MKAWTIALIGFAALLVAAFSMIVIAADLATFSQMIPSIDPHIIPSIDPHMIPSIDPHMIPSIDPHMIPSIDPH